MPKVSVIIPCYNQGGYLDEAVDSVLAQTFQDFEIVVVNDGSTDEATNALLAAYAKPKTKVVATPNQGLAMARNNGIRASRGEYILPLDADDKIGPKYLEEAVKVLDENPEIGIVYCEAEYFDGRTGRWELTPYSFESILRDNMIFCTSFFRRADFDRTLGYNPNMLYGWEDWDLWLSFHELGKKVFKLQDVHFYYRIRLDSMVHKLDDEQKDILRQLVYRNHLTFYAEHFQDPINLSLENEILQGRLLSIGEHLELLKNQVITIGKQRSDIYGQLQKINRSKEYRVGKIFLSPLRTVEGIIKKRSSSFADQNPSGESLIQCQYLSTVPPIEKTPLQHITLAVLSVIFRYPRLTKFLRLIHYHIREPYRAIKRQITLRTKHHSSQDLITLKEKFRKQATMRLHYFFNDNDKLVIPSAPMPKVSILLILYNQAALTLGCLQSLWEETSVLFETIVVDNCSQDETCSLLKRVEGIRVIRNTENVGFLKAVNQAAALAKGDYLLLLNNDAVLLPGTLGAACKRIESSHQIGAVGGKIVLPDGRLQEAGSIVWQDGSCLGYGRGDDPRGPEYQFVREVDFCSGAFLLIRKQIFEKLGGFDEAFAPAYYEESDFCVRLRKAGYSVVYDPKVVINHFEFASSTTKEHAIMLQRRNWEIFQKKHRDFLASKEMQHPTAILKARMYPPAKGRILVIDDRVPQLSMGQGYPRAVSILRKLVEFGYFVTFYPLSFPDDTLPPGDTSLPDVIEIFLHAGREQFEKFLEERTGYYDRIIVSRPHNMKLLTNILHNKPQYFKGLSIIYDAEAVFALRLRLQKEICGDIDAEPLAAIGLEEELDLAANAKCVITVSSGEAAHFQQHGQQNVLVVGHSLHAEPTPASFTERNGLLFVGALNTDPSPNVDSMVWFAKVVWPVLEKMTPSPPKLSIVGSCRAYKIQMLASEYIKVMGRQEDLFGFYNAARVFIIPTRFAAGIPFKAHEAAAAGVPLIVSPLIAKQLGWTHEKELLVAETPEEFARQTLRLHEDETLWNKLRERALARVKLDCADATFSTSLQRALSTT